MLLITDRQLTLHGELHLAGVPFDEPDESVAADLIQRGFARKALAPKIQYETKVIVPGPPGVRYETKAQEQDEEDKGNEVAPGVSDSSIPFRDGVVSDEKQTGVVAESDSGLSETDVPVQGTPSSRGRRGRKGSSTK